MITKKELRIIVAVFLPCMYPVLLNSLCQYQHFENNASNIVFSFVKRKTAALCNVIVTLSFPTNRKPVKYWVCKVCVCL